MKGSPKEWKELVRMREQDRVSQASSLATISAFPVTAKGKISKVHNFGKRASALKRDPNCPVVIRGWLYKQDSSGLKLWKRRWFVLSDFCLFYYKDSREESVLGSIPLPSYKILFCTSRECKNRKYTFKAVHQGMRSYFFSADTQEDVLGWVRALSQSACMEAESSLNRRCSSFQDFTQLGGSSESLTFFQMSSPRNGRDQAVVHGNGLPSDPCYLQRAQAGTPQKEHRERQMFIHSPSPRTSTPSSYGGHRRYGQPLNQEGSDQDSHQTPPSILKSTGSRPLTPRCQLGSRPHTPVGRVDIRPNDDHLPSQNAGCSPPSPKWDFSSSSLTPTIEKRLLKGSSSTSSHPHASIMQRGAGKACSQAGSLPPLPPPRIAHAPPSPHHHHGSPVSVCLLQSAMLSDPYQEREQQSFRPLELDVDAILTRICGCDKLLLSLSKELAQLEADKDNVQYALEMARLQLDAHKVQGIRGHSIQGNDGLSQKALLQEELVMVRARLCNVCMEMEKVWSQYERMESELSVVRSHLQHICRFGRPQEQSQAQRELWMMEDILCGLKTNRNHFRAIMGSQRQTVLQKAGLHQEARSPQMNSSPSGVSMEVELDPPPRPPLPQELQQSSLSLSRDTGRSWLDSESEVVVFSSDLSPRHQSVDRRGNSLTVLPGEKKRMDTMPAALHGFAASSWATPDTATKRAKMSEEEQRERIRRNQERISNQKKESLPTAMNHIQCHRTSPPREEPPFPIRVTRVHTALLPSALIARRVSVEDPPPELYSPFPQQISTGANFSERDQSQKSQNAAFQETLNQNSPWLKTGMAEDQPHPDLPSTLSSEMFEDKADLPNTDTRMPKQNKHKLVKKEDSSQFHNHNLGNIPSNQSTEASEENLKDVSGIQAEKTHWSHDWSASESERLVTDHRTEEGGPTMPAVTLGNGRREKPGPRASLVASDLDPDHHLTPEQREAKLKRVERIKERVMKSAAREINVHPHSSPIGGDRDRIVNLSLTLANDSLKKNVETAAQSEGVEECQFAEALHCSGGCHSDGNPDLGLQVTNKLKPSRIPSINANKVRRSLKGAGSLRKTPIDNHSKNSADVNCNDKAIYQNQMSASKLMLFSTKKSLQSVQKEDDSYPSHNTENETIKQGGKYASQKRHFSNKRTEWFLSDNHKVDYIPLMNQSKESSNHEERLQFPSDQRMSEVNESAVSEYSVEDSKKKSTEPTNTLLPPQPILTDHTQHFSTPDDLINETKNSNEIEARILEETTTSEKQMTISDQSNDKPILSEMLANGESQKTQQSNDRQGSGFTDEVNDTPPELLTNQTIPIYATIHFMPPMISDISQGNENNSLLLLSNETGDSQSDPQNANQMISSLTKSTKDLHIYEEISFSSTHAESQFDRSQNSALLDNQLTSSRYLLSSPSEMLSTNLSSIDSSDQSGRKERGNEKDVADWPAVNKSPSEGRTDSDEVEGSLSHSEVRKDVPLRKDVVSYNSEVKDNKDNQSCPFARARVTIVRTSL